MFQEEGHEAKPFHILIALAPGCSEQSGRASSSCLANNLASGIQDSTLTSSSTRGAGDEYMYSFVFLTPPAPPSETVSIGQTRVLLAASAKHLISGILEELSIKRFDWL